jgi:hypothetical protein
MLLAPLSYVARNLLGEVDPDIFGTVLEDLLFSLSLGGVVAWEDEVVNWLEIVDFGVEIKSGLELRSSWSCSRLQNVITASAMRS